MFLFTKNNIFNTWIIIPLNNLNFTKCFYATCYYKVNLEISRNLYDFIVFQVVDYDSIIFAVSNITTQIYLTLNTKKFLKDAMLSIYLKIWKIDLYLNLHKRFIFRYWYYCIIKNFCVAFYKFCFFLKSLLSLVNMSYSYQI